jgi:hypothetical protein
MHSALFGFEAMGERHRATSGGPMMLPRVEARFDLTGYLKRRLGEFFVPHPHLHSLILMNGVGGRNYLTPEAASEAWTRGEWEIVSLALEARTGAIESLYRRLLRGELRTDFGLIGPHSPLSEEVKRPRRKPRKKDPKQDARDKWLLGRKEKGDKYSLIRSQLNQIAVEKGWEDISTDQGIQQAIDRFEKRLQHKT